MANTLRTELGEQLMNWRMTHGEILYDMAKGSGLSCSVISAIETGRKEPTCEQLYTLLMYVLKKEPRYDLPPDMQARWERALKIFGKLL